MAKDTVGKGILTHCYKECKLILKIKKKTFWKSHSALWIKSLKNVHTFDPVIQFLGILS